MAAPKKINTKDVADTGSSVDEYEVLCEYIKIDTADGEVTISTGETTSLVPKSVAQSLVSAGSIKRVGS